MESQIVALWESFTLSRPELLLAGAALLATLLGAWFRDRATVPLTIAAAAALASAGALAWLDQPLRPVDIYNGVLRIDGYAALAKTIIGFAAAATLLMTLDGFRANERRFELPILVLLAGLGFFVMASANDLVALYIGIELQSLASYVLAAFRRDDARSSEAGLKYFVLGALSSGLLLYGASLIYGFSGGAIRFDEIALAVASGEGTVGLIFGLVFLICGLAFKMSAAPFHMWTPDVYEGAPSPVTAMFAAAPKVAAVALLARVLYGPFAEMEDQWRQVIVALSALSFVVGSFAALVQTNVKRLMAYSSINNIGFVLMALAAGFPAGGANGAEAALLYLAFYVPATIGCFAVFIAMQRAGEPTERIEDLAGLAQRSPGFAIVLTALMFSLAGIPPLIGFWGKLYVFEAALQAGLWPLAIVGAIATVIAAGYYLRLIALVWFSPPVAAFDRAGGSLVLTGAVATALVFPGLVLALQALESAASLAAQSSFPAP